MAQMNSTTVSQHFCCKHCQSDVAIEVEIGGDLSYVCQNNACKWACSVDCPEALALKPAAPIAVAPVITLATPAARKAAYNAAQGIKAVPTTNGYLVPSSSRGNIIHFVAADGRCSCEAGQSGKACWHVAFVALDAAA